jgi:molybdopterin-guanine dinucleotide biosynthesis protein A
MTTNPGSGSDTPGPTVPVYILAGGRSRRFGSDKARALVGGVPLLVSVARCLEPVASRTTVVAGEAGAYSDLGFDTIADVVAQRGPLGGLLTAIEHSGPGRWLFLSACDWVGVRADWVVRLLERRAPGVQAVVYKGERFEPLFALYHTSLRDTVAGLIESGRLETRNVFARATTEVLPPPRGWGAATNLNRPPT